MPETPLATQVQPVEYYGCCLCQKQHFEDTDPVLYKQHLFHQSKHGIHLLRETLEERKQRYGIASEGTR